MSDSDTPMTDNPTQFHPNKARIITDWSQFNNFSEWEFRCQCQKCGNAWMDEWFMDDIQDLRNFLDQGMTITSGYRCPLHNAAVSTTGVSGPHTTGKAIGFLCDAETVTKVLQFCLSLDSPVSINGFGVRMHGPHDKRFVHLDSVHDRETLWTYS